MPKVHITLNLGSKSTRLGFGDAWFQTEQELQSLRWNCWVWPFAQPWPAPLFSIPMSHFNLTPAALHCRYIIFTWCQRTPWASGYDTKTKSGFLMRTGWNREPERTLIGLYQNFTAWLNEQATFNSSAQVAQSNLFQQHLYLQTKTSIGFTWSESENLWNLITNPAGGGSVRSSTDVPLSIF